MKFTYSEGATPVDDISYLKPVWVKTQEDLNNVEAENISSAASKYLLKSVFTSIHTLTETVGFHG